MCASFNYKEIKVDEDDPAVLATQLYERHGYQKALSTVIHYINATNNLSQRFEWQLVAKELTELSLVDDEIERAGLS